MEYRIVKKSTKMDYQINKNAPKWTIIMYTNIFNEYS